MAEGKKYLNEGKAEARRIADLLAKTVQDALVDSKESTKLAVELSNKALSLSKSSDEGSRMVTAAKEEVLRSKDQVDRGAK